MESQLLFCFAIYVPIHMVWNNKSQVRQLPMGSFLDEVKRLFDTDNLYTLLGCDKSSSPAESNRFSLTNNIS